ncbi:MAG: hypothetical protein ACI8UO_004655, partial [Verrucomicrobiales bacterium]
MLSSMRKAQKSLLIVVATVICIAMVWFGTGEKTQNQVLLTVDGEKFSVGEVSKLAKQFTLAQSLGQRGKTSYEPTELEIFAYEMYGNRPNEAFGSDRTGFVTRLVILRNEATRLGVEPSPEEINAKLKSLPAFVDQEGVFSESELDSFLRLNGSVRRQDVEQVVGDLLTLHKLKQLLGAGMKPTQWQVDQSYEQSYEEFTAYEVFLKREDYEKDIEISEEAINAYYEENKEGFQSIEKRAFDYVMLTLPPKPEPKPVPGAGFNPSGLGNLPGFEQFNLGTGTETAPATPAPAPATPAPAPATPAP